MSLRCGSSASHRDKCSGWVLMGASITCAVMQAEQGQPSSAQTLLCGSACRAPHGQHCIPCMAWQEPCSALHPLHQRFFFWIMHSELFSSCSPAVGCSSEELGSWCSPPPSCTVLWPALSPCSSWQPLVQHSL